MVQEKVKHLRMRFSMTHFSQKSQMQADKESIYPSNMVTTMQGGLRLCLVIQMLIKCINKSQTRINNELRMSLREDNTVLVPVEQLHILGLWWAIFWQRTLPEYHSNPLSPPGLQFYFLFANLPSASCCICHLPQTGAFHAICGMCAQVGHHCYKRYFNSLLSMMIIGQWQEKGVKSFRDGSN